MKDKLITIAACVVFLAGAAIFCYPLAKSWYYDYNTSHVLDSYKDEIKELSRQKTEKMQKPYLLSKIRKQKKYFPICMRKWLHTIRVFMKMNKRI